MMRTVNRKMAYDAIDSEREYQDHLWRDIAHPADRNPLCIGEFLLLIEEYAARARKDWTGEHTPETATLNGIRKIAGIAVNCMEQHGSPQREGFKR